MKIAVILCLLALMAGCLLPACSKEAVLDVYGSAVEALGNVGLTAGIALEGERKFGEDKYTGSYRADYVNYTGDEGLFGGTMLEKREEEHVTLSGSIRCEAGTAKLVWNCGEAKPVTVAEGEGAFSRTVYLSPGSNYFNFTADGFTGSLDLKIE